MLVPKKSTQKRGGLLGRRGLADVLVRLGATREHVVHFVEVVHDKRDADRPADHRQNARDLERASKKVIFLMIKVIFLHQVKISTPWSPKKDVDASAVPPASGPLQARRVARVRLEGRT